MPWFLVDDKSHSHPKFRDASNAAIGLWVVCGSWIAEHLTDGVIPGSIVKMYGTPAQARKLVEVGLWHKAGHDCTRCPQPKPGDFHMHDYAQPGHGNKTRNEVERAREYEREKKAKQRTGRRPQPPPPPQGPGLFDDEPPPPPGGGQSRRPETGPIPESWQPSEDDVAAAQLARTDTGRDQLTPAQLAEVTRKFVQRMRDDGKTAAAWGSRWQEWAARERTEQAGVVVHGEFGQQQTKGQQQRAGLARLREQHRQGGMA